jgi:hypothetical protein
MAYDNPSDREEIAVTEIIGRSSTPGRRDPPVGSNVEAGSRKSPTLERDRGSHSWTVPVFSQPKASS